MTIKNPVEWSWAQLVHTAHALGSAGRSLSHVQETIHSPAPAVRKITVSDIYQAVRRGLDDFGACRADVISVCVLYPIVGLIFARLAFGGDLLPLLFPVASGFALIGPIAAVGLYEMSRRRELGQQVTWRTAFEVVKAPAFGTIALVGLLLTAIFLAWLLTAWVLYALTLGPEPPLSAEAFAHDLFYTEAGWALIAVGIGAGFLFALLAMSISVVSFPLLLDRDVGLDTAIATSVKAVRTNLGPMLLWGLIVAAMLVLGSLPAFIGLVIAVPVLGHATWHLYRKLVARS